MSSKQKLLAVIPFLAALGLLVSFFPDFSDKTENVTTQNQDQEVKKINIANSEARQKELLDAADQVDQTAHPDHAQAHNTKDSNGDLKAFPKGFDFKQEAIELNKLKSEYPRSRGELIDMVLSANAYANAKAHSAAELAQRQKGALKVEALKALVQLEEDKEVSKRQLTRISEDSKDPVMRRIAKAALDSQAKGRPFFSDTVRALGNLPVPE